MADADAGTPDASQVLDATPKPKAILAQHFLFYILTSDEYPIQQRADFWSIGHEAPAITASISHVSRGHFVMFLQPLAVTSCKMSNTRCQNRTETRCQKPSRPNRLHPYSKQAPNRHVSLRKF